MYFLRKNSSSFGCLFDLQSDPDKRMQFELLLHLPPAIVDFAGVPKGYRRVFVIY